jgi:hypothetical protein
VSDGVLAPLGSIDRERQTQADRVDDRVQVALYILIAGGFWGGFMFACKALSKGAHTTPATVLPAILLYGAGGLLFGAFTWSGMQKRLRKQQALADSLSH